MARLLPMPTWQAPSLKALPADLSAATAVMFLSVPAGMAYATIAELPPALGLYAAAMPAIVGGLFRSSDHVVTGPTNALSLLVGGAVLAAEGVDPVAVAVTLATLVGVLQVVAGGLRLGAIVDFISSAVVLGYITGAAVLIGVGQLYNAIGTTGPRGLLHTSVGGWLQTVGDGSAVAVAMCGATVGSIVLLRWRKSRVPSAIVVIGAATLATWAFDLPRHGLRVVRDIAPVPAGLPPITLPDLSLLSQLLPVAIACTVLSLIESNAVARSIAARTGQPLEPSVEFTGQGFSNIAAGLFCGYPCSGSLSRSALNERAGARTRYAGMLSGALMIVVLVVAGPALNYVPMPALAGLLLVVAWDLIDVPRLRATWRASGADRTALVATVVGTWVLPLDKAIYLGVGLSVVLFLRRARLLQIVELELGEDGDPREVPLGDLPEGACPRIRFVQATGPLFFASIGPLVTALAPLVEDARVQTVVLRLRRTTGLDATAALALGELASRMRAHQRELVLTGLSEDELRVLERSGAAKAFGDDCLLQADNRWFGGLRRATARCHDDLCEDCPLSGSPAAPHVEARSSAFASPRPLARSTPPARQRDD